jgi:hypothetical protein
MDEWTAKLTAFEILLETQPKINVMDVSPSYSLQRIFFQSFIPYSITSEKITQLFFRPFAHCPRTNICSTIMQAATTTMITGVE